MGGVYRAKDMDMEVGFQITADRTEWSAFDALPRSHKRVPHVESTHSSGGGDGVPSTTVGISLIFVLQFVHPVRVLAALLLILLPAASLRAQGNYEVQVYGSEMVPPTRTMVELHSNFTFEGSKTEVDGVRPDNHALHETIEITQGFTSWFETGFYIFMGYRTGEGYQWVGDHIRPRVRIPEEWHWPVNVSLSTEIGYQRRSYSPDTW